MHEVKNNLNITDMTLTKKIIVWAIVTIIAAPGIILVMNGNEDAVYYNFIGLAYLWLAVKACNRFMPQWMKDYLNSDCELDDEFDD